MSKSQMIMLVIIFIWMLLGSLQINERINGIHERFDALNERLETIQETVDTIQITLQDSTLLLKTKHHGGNTYIDLWQGKDFE